MTFLEAKAEAGIIVRKFARNKTLVMQFEARFEDESMIGVDCKIIYFPAILEGAEMATGKSWREALDNLFIQAKSHFDWSRPKPGTIEEAPADDFSDPLPVRPAAGPDEAPAFVSASMKDFPAILNGEKTAEDFGVRDSDFLKGPVPDLSPAEREQIHLDPENDEYALKPCRECNGTGIAPGFASMPCPTCTPRPETAVRLAPVPDNAPENVGEGSRIDPKTDPTISPDSTGSLQETPPPPSDDPGKQDSPKIAEDDYPF